MFGFSDMLAIRLASNRIEYGEHILIGSMVVREEVDLEPGEVYGEETGGEKNIIHMS